MPNHVHGILVLVEAGFKPGLYGNREAWAAGNHPDMLRNWNKLEQMPSSRALLVEAAGFATEISGSVQLTVDAVGKCVIIRRRMVFHIGSQPRSSVFEPTTLRRDFAARTQATPQSAPNNYSIFHYSRSVVVVLSDETLTCRDCGVEFVFTVGEQEFYASKGFTNKPSRCPSCRAARKARVLRRRPDGRLAEDMASAPGVRCTLQPAPSAAAKPRFHSCPVGIVQYIALDALTKYEGKFVSQFSGLANEAGGTSSRLFCCLRANDPEVSV